MFGAFKTVRHFVCGTNASLSLNIFFRRGHPTRPPISICHLDNSPVPFFYLFILILMDKIEWRMCVCGSHWQTICYKLSHTHTHVHIFNVRARVHFRIHLFLAIHSSRSFLCFRSACCHGLMFYYLSIVNYLVALRVSGME